MNDRPSGLHGKGSLSTADVLSACLQMPEVMAGNAFSNFPFAQRFSSTYYLINSNRTEWVWEIANSTSTTCLWTMGCCLRTLDKIKLHRDVRFLIRNISCSSSAVGEFNSSLDLKWTSSVYKCNLDSLQDNTRCTPSVQEGACLQSDTQSHGSHREFLFSSDDSSLK